MSTISRRALAKFVVDELLAGRAAKQVAQQIAAILVDSGRGQEIDFLVGDINSELEKRGELAVAKVTSAHPLPKQLEAELKQQLKKALDSKQVILEANVDKSVVGGVRIETASRVWDQTVKHKLTNLKEAFDG